MAQARAIRTKAAVLTAARTVFARAGFDGARVDEIAKVSGANKQRIYANYSSKEGLFSAVQNEAVASLASFEEALLPDIEAHPRQMGTLLLSGYLRFHRDHPEFWRLLAWSNLGTLTPAGKGGKRMMNIARLRAVFAVSQKAGGMPRETSFDAWFLTLTSVVVFLFANQRTASVNLGLDLEDQATRERLAKEVLNLIGPRGAAKR